MKFSEKNDFIVKHADDGEFHSDLELFKEHYPNDRLNHDLARANSTTCRRLDGSMLLKLLDKVAPAEILAHRDATKKSERQRLEDERKAAEERKRLDEIAEAEQQKKILAEAAEAALIEQQRLEKEAEDERRRLEEQRGYPYWTPYGVSLQCTKLPRVWYKNQGIVSKNIRSKFLEA